MAADLHCLKTWAERAAVVEQYLAALKSVDASSKA